MSFESSFFKYYNKDVRYRIFIGLNDKFLKSQIITIQNAKELIKKVCDKYIDGFTIILCEGQYKKYCNSNSTENTILLEVVSTNIEKVENTAMELKRVFNQSTILIQGEIVYNKFI